MEEKAKRVSRCGLLLVLACLAALTTSPAADGAGASLLGWGDGFRGQLGDGSTGNEAVTIPVAAKGISSATEVATGFSHSLVLLDDGTVLALGGNSYGELGDGTSEDRLSPVSVPGLTGTIAVAAGAEHSLALRSDGTVLAWGANGKGQLGIGDGASGPEVCTTTRPCRRTAAPVPGLTDVIAIAASLRWSLALRADGTVVAWGENQLGQTGDGVGLEDGCECIDHPVAVPGVGGAVAISAGVGSGYALLADGTVKSWGFNQVGQLGSGVSGGPGECVCLPALTAAGVGGVDEIVAGGEHALVLHPAGDVEAWGADGFGQLGRGAPTETGCHCVPSAVPVPALAATHALLGGRENSYALLADGTVRSWGLGKGGGIGNGSISDSASPTPVSGVAGASGLGGNSGTQFALIGPSQALDVSFAGSGSGVVGTRGLVCSSAAPCREAYPQGQIEVLRAEPAPGSGFAGFTGACTGTGPCRVELDGDRSLTATFGPPKGTKITKTTIKRRQRKARFAFTAPGAITGFQCRLFRPKPKKVHAKAGTSKKTKRRRKPKFAACRSGRTYKNLKPGRYRFEVRALDILGADANPAQRKFKLKAPKRPKRR